MNTFIDPYLYNLYSSGLIKPEEKSEDYITLNKDYIITLSKKDTIWFTDSYNYICTISIKNNLNVNILDITMSELDVYCFIDNIHQYLYSNLNELYIPLKFSNNQTLPLKFCNYQISLNKKYDCNTDMIIKDNNIERLKIEFNEEYLISFANLLYFSFIVFLDLESDSNLNRYINNYE